MGDVPMRTHRIVGRSELFIGGEWMTVGGTSASAARDASRMLYPNELVSVTGRGGITALGYFDGALYNGTECTLTRVVYRLTTRTGGDSSIRTFSQSEYIVPRETKSVFFKSDGPDAARLFVAWAIDSAQGTCAKHAQGSSRDPFVDAFTPKSSVP